MNRLVGKFVQDTNGNYIKNSSTAGDYKLVNKDGTPDLVHSHIEKLETKKVLVALL